LRCTADNVDVENGQALQWFISVACANKDGRLSPVVDLGSWLGAELIRNFGGVWICLNRDVTAARVGFSQFFLEIAPFKLASHIIAKGGNVDELCRELIGVSKSIYASTGSSRYRLRHYLRLHFMPRGDWLAVDTTKAKNRWSSGSLSTVIRDLRPHKGFRTDEALLEQMSTLRLNEPAGTQMDHRAYERYAELTCVKYATDRFPLDLIERTGLPSLFLEPEMPVLSTNDLARLRAGISPLTVLCDAAMRSRQSDDLLLGMVPDSHTASAYADSDSYALPSRTWRIVCPTFFASATIKYPDDLRARYDEFCRYIATKHSVLSSNREYESLARSSMQCSMAIVQALKSATDQNLDLVFRVVRTRGTGTA
jgi:hypothetical protein